jgi:hypothetical protein
MKTLTKINRIYKLMAVFMILVFISVSLPQFKAFAESTTLLSITGVKTGGNFTVTVANAQKDSSYYVKLDDANKDGIVYYKIGMLKTDKYSAGKGTYSLPSQLLSTTVFNICLKNAVTNELLCNNAALSHYDDSTSPTGPASFTVTRNTKSLVIATLNYPKNSSYRVKVRDNNLEKVVWYIIGSLKTDKVTSGSYTYQLTTEEAAITSLKVCLKNQTTDSLACVVSNK